MKILAIRGENLASLADPFEISFETEPVCSSGIFAITGPTGAGKSTILDTICLALYDRLPRMDTADKSAAIGKADGDAQQVKYNDVRGILRHGAACAYAEVDFVGQDGRSYRSRWEVKRTLGKASGKFKNQQITLTDRDSGDIIGDKKTGTLREIEKRIGLTFNQFRRAVLLAQGDFDTFLRAASKDKAELLEKITGTEIYSKISQAAFAHAKDERQALLDLELQRGEHTALGDEERVDAEERTKLTQSELSQIKTEEEFLTKFKGWYDIKDRLDKGIAEGQKLFDAALQAHDVAQPDRDNLALTKKGLALGAELLVAATANSHFKEAETALAEALAVEKSRSDQRDIALSASTVCQLARDQKRKAYEGIGPEIEKAQQLDAFIETTTVDLARRREILDQYVHAKDAAAKIFTEVEEALRKEQDEFKAAHRWLDQHKFAERMSVCIEDVTRDLSEWIELKNEIASIIRDLNIVNGEVRANAVAHKAKENEVAALQAQEHALAKKIEPLKEITDGIDRSAAETQRDQIIRSQSALDDAKNAANAAAKAQTGIISAEADKAKQDKIVLESMESISKIDLSLPTEDARLEEAKRSLDLSQAAESDAAEHLRLTLKDGEPCPVCGSSEHPVTEVDRRLKGRMDSDRQHVKELETRLAALRSDRAQAKARIAAAEDSIPDITKRRSDCEADLEVARETWDMSTTAIRSGCKDLSLSIPSLAHEATDPKATEPLIGISDTLEQSLTEIKRLLNRASEANQQAVALSADREKVRANVHSAGAEVVTLKAEEQSKTSRSAVLGATLEQRQKVCVAVTSRLDLAVAPIFPDWRLHVAASKNVFDTKCHDLVNDWKNYQRKKETSNTAVSRLSADLQGSRATLAAKRAAAQEEEIRYLKKGAEVEQLTCERSLIIGGRLVSDVRTEYRRQWEDAEEAWKKAEKTRFQAEMTAVAAASNVVSARNASSTRQVEHDSAERALIEKLQAYEISREQAEAAIANGEVWVIAEEIRLDAIREDLAVKRATLGERKKEAAIHAANDHPQLMLEQVLAALSDIDTRRTKASDDFMAASAKLANNKLLLIRIAEIMSALDNRKEVARVWEQLDDLIGSADGAKFRKYAQALTFNHLIRLANRHLADLHPRYELQRAPVGDLVLQVVDRDMADEVRGVHSLSGGESFLVSLALALGLASMSSSRGIKVESLFIDEGFGSLDSTSLAMAVSVLEQLQATGRRVGVISHVEELKERIAVKVEVSPVGRGRSSVKVVTV